LQVYGAGAAADEGAATVVEAGRAQVEVVGAQVGVAAVEVAADLRLQLSVGHEAGCVGVEQVGAEGEVAGTGCAAGESRLLAAMLSAPAAGSGRGRRGLSGLGG
jgi:hypothetical protein